MGLGFPFVFLTDPQREMYREFGLGRTSWKVFFAPKTLFRYLSLIWKGWKIVRENSEEDLLQLGGDFILDASGRLVFAFRSSEPTDRPSTEDLKGAIRRLIG